MNRNLYIILIFFLGASIICSLANSLFYLQVGVPMFRLHSYGVWFIMANVISAMGSILLLRYYYYRNQLLAFYTGIISLIATLGQSTIFYMILTAGGSWSGYFAPARLVWLGTVILYAIVLIFSITRRKIWLKSTGMYLLVTGVLLLAITIASRYSPNVSANILLGKVGQWVTIAGNLGSLLYIMNFLSELNLLKKEKTNIPHTNLLKTLSAWD
jgi:hypothetical protein